MSRLEWNCPLLTVKIMTCDLLHNRSLLFWVEYDVRQNAFLVAHLPHSHSLEHLSVGVKWEHCGAANTRAVQQA